MPGRSWFWRHSASRTSRTCACAARACGDALVVVLVAQLEQLEEQLLLRCEAVQQPRLAHPDAPGDGRQGRAAEPAGCEDLVGRREDRVAPLAPLGVPAPLPARGAHRAGA